MTIMRLITFKYFNRLTALVCRHSHKVTGQSGDYAVFDHWIYKNPWFKKCFNIASTTDEHILYLNNHSVGYLTMYYYVFGRRLSFKHIKRHKFMLFLIYM